MAEITISAIQTKIEWENVQTNLRLLEPKISGLKGKTQVVVLPEMFTTGFSMNPAPMAKMYESTLEWMRQTSKDNRVILTGSLIAKEGDHFFNRMIWMQPDGNFGFYDKRHLFAFSGEHNHYSFGNERLITSVMGWKFNLQVCYDLRFPVWSRQSSPETPEYDALIYVANWPEVRSHAWKSLLVARAIENQCYVIGVNRCGKDAREIYYSGDTMIVDPLGETMAHVAHDEDILTCKLSRELLDSTRTRFPFLKDGDHFKLL